MFKKAIKKNFSYTRPLLIGERVFGNDNVMSGIGTFIVLNEEGYILTCKHIAEKIRTAELLDQKYENYLKEIQRKSEQEIKKINKKYDYIDKIFQIKNIFMNCFEEYACQGNDRNDFDDDEQYDDYIDEIVENMDNDERIYAVFGEESDNLVDFIDMFEINDLHEANYGITKDGRAVIFDFSGYCG